MKSIVTYAPPKMNPLPGTITDAAIRDATLPVKIETARRAIQECQDLSELLRYRDQAEGLAAAVRVMKHVAPEMVRSANEMVADAWRKGGELLAQYSNAVSIIRSDKKELGNFRGTKPSPRREICKSLGVSPKDASQMVRIASAPKTDVYAAMRRTRSLNRIANLMPAVNPANSRVSQVYTAAMRQILGSGNGNGLYNAKSALARIPLDAFKQLMPDERKVVKAKITEIMELLDEMDRLCR